MKQITFVFATGDSWMDRLVMLVTKSHWSHVAMKFDDDEILVEALAGKGLILQAGKKYDDWAPSTSITRLVSESAYEQMLTLSQRWGAANVSYGYRTCLAIGVRELLGQQAGSWALECLCWRKKETLVCSELLIKLWRVQDPQFLSGSDPRLSSPEDIFKALATQAPSS
jgi:hypothetical protein